VPAELGRLTALRMVFLHDNKLTSVPADCGEWEKGGALHKSGYTISR